MIYSAGRFQGSSSSKLKTDRILRKLTYKNENRPIIPTNRNRPVEFYKRKIKDYFVFDCFCVELDGWTLLHVYLFFAH